MALRELTGNVQLRGAGASFVSAPGQMSHPLSGKRQHVNTAAVVKLRKNFAQMKQELIRDGVNKIRAEFGAYMHYSWWQERGTHNKDGSWKLRPRPHIVPAVEKHYADILNAQRRALINLSQAMILGQKVTPQREIINSWIQVLNGPVAQSAREWARALGVFEFGMHIRSIHGYAAAGSGLLGPSSGALGKMRSARTGRSVARSTRRSATRAKTTSKRQARSKLKKLQGARKASIKRSKEAPKKAAKRQRILKKRATAHAKEIRARATARKKARKLKVTRLASAARVRRAAKIRAHPVKRKGIKRRGTK